MSIRRLTVRYSETDLDIKQLDASQWSDAPLGLVGTYWSGDAAPAIRHFTAKLLWSDTTLYVRLEADQSEPLVISDTPDTSSKTLGLWDRDVCEIFIAPDKMAPNRYFEFEIAPTGEWLDLAIDSTSGQRVIDRDYASGMESAARIDKDKIVLAIKIPFSAFGKTPKHGDIWLGNLFRCVGEGATRGYLAWQPTKTKTPNFHVPAAFGEFEFVR